MNDQKIYELVAQHPRIRASRLAELLNTPMIDVSQSLRCLVDVGDLTRSVEFDDNGRQFQVYELSEAFRKDRAGKAVLACVAAKPVVKDEPAPAPEPAAPAAVQPKPETAAPSKVDLAIAYLREHKQATNKQLHDAMGLTKLQSPQAYLNYAIRNGLVVRDGEMWRPGSGVKPAVVVPKFADNVVAVGNVVLATRDQTAVPQKAIDAVRTETARPDRRCAIWSDGMVEIQRDGRLQAQLSREDAEFLSDFIIGLRAKATA